MTRCTVSKVANLLPALFLLTAPSVVTAANLAISCGAVGQELQLCKEGVQAWSKETGHQVEVISTPQSTTERLALYQQILAAGGTDIDVYQVDVIWPGILHNHFIDLKSSMGEEVQKHFKAIIANNTVGGRLVAVPWFTDAGVLFYRKDLLKKYNEPVPTTWQAMTQTAKRIQDAERQAGNQKMWGYVWQGKAYEGLTCNALEWVVSHGAGAVLNADGSIAVRNPAATSALALAQSWIKTISPQGVLSYTEEEARGVFQSGNAVFMRNWPYAWALANSADSPVKGQVEVTSLPKGGTEGRSTGALGGWNLAVSKYSKHPNEAASLVRFLTSRAEQKRRAVVASYNPTRMSLYQDGDVLLANPFFGTLYPTFVNAVPRPSSIAKGQYNRVSKEFFNAVHQVLSGSRKPEQALTQLERRLKRIRRRGW